MFPEYGPSHPILKVALAWCKAKGAVPIPGAKRAAQAAEHAGALGWALDADDVAALDTKATECGFS